MWLLQHVSLIRRLEQEYKPGLGYCEKDPLGGSLNHCAESLLMLQSVHRSIIYLQCTTILKANQLPRDPTAKILQSYHGSSITFCTTRDLSWRCSLNVCRLPRYNASAELPRFCELIEQPPGRTKINGTRSKLAMKRPLGA
jgi:hypothetical protein